MGDVISATRGKRQVKSGSNQFTNRKRERFLDALALTCNVTKAAEFAGIGTSSIHRAKARDDAFAQQWQEALAIGYDRLESLVLEHGGAGVPIEPDPERAEAAGAKAEPFDFERALKILTYRRGARDGRRVQTGRPVRNASREETTAALLKALAAAKRRVGVKLGMTDD